MIGGGIVSRMPTAGQRAQERAVLVTSIADVAIVALSLAIVSEGSYFVIEEGAHKPLDQAMVVCADGKKRERAASFEAFVNSEKGREIMKRYGFLLPGEKTAAN